MNLSINEMRVRYYGKVRGNVEFTDYLNEYHSDELVNWAVRYFNERATGFTEDDGKWFAYGVWTTPVLEEIRKCNGCIDSSAMLRLTPAFCRQCYGLILDYASITDADVKLLIDSLTPADSFILDYLGKQDVTFTVDNYDDVLRDIGVRGVSTIGEDMVRIKNENHIVIPSEVKRFSDRFFAPYSTLRLLSQTVCKGKCILDIWAGLCFSEFLKG